MNLADSKAGNDVGNKVGNNVGSNPDNNLDNNPGAGQAAHPVTPDIRTTGENAVIVYLGDAISPRVSARVQAATRACEAALGDDLVDMAPSYASLLVVFDCLRTDHASVRDRLRQCLAELEEADANAGRLVELPAWYGPEAGPDIEDLARRAGLGVSDVIDIHQSAEYRVYAIGFAPGFAYLGEVDPRIAAPRLDTPRRRVPRGAVAIADRQTAVYPAVSPGGWNLIGLCPSRMFDPDRTPPMPVAVGDRVRFCPISRERFLELGGEPPQPAKQT